LRHASWEDAFVEADFVFVHGFTQTPASWDPVLQAMQHEVVGDDGGVRLFIVPRTVVGSDFRHSAAALGVAEATYIGYSQGGRLALQLALDRPDVVRRLVLVSASPGIADGDARTARRDADERLAQEIERDGVDAFLERWLAQPLFATLPPERAGLDERRADSTVESLTQQLRVLGQGAQPSNWERLGELRMPVQLIVGGLDTKYVDLAHHMAELIADARVDVIDGAGHACHLEQPERVAHLLASFSA
jgi:2-succinyl-6-hydroxy-2,4-cyclohexadiene-1-carboxylate synthase